MNVLKPTLCILITLLSGAGDSFAQPSGVVNPLLRSDTVVWYGMDWSQLSINDYMLIGKEEEVKSIFLPQWTGFLKQRYPLDRIKSDFRKRHVIDASHVLLNSFQILKVDSLIAIDRKSTVGTNDIRTQISSYRLDESRGLGLAMFMATISRTLKKTEIVWVFFDIETREPLLTFKGASNLGNGNSMKHYANSFLDCFKNSSTFYQRRVPQETW